MIEVGHQLRASHGVSEYLYLIVSVTLNIRLKVTELSVHGEIKRRKLIYNFEEKFEDCIYEGLRRECDGVAKFLRRSCEGPAKFLGRYYGGIAKTGGMEDGETMEMKVSKKATFTRL